jgi:hypothetical protein
MSQNVMERELTRVEAARPAHRAASGVPAVCRFCLYGLFICVALEAMVLSVLAGRADDVAAENHIAQWMQAGLLGLTAGLLIAAGRARAEMRPLTTVFAMLSCLAVIREMDDVWQITGIENGWQIGFAPAAAFLGVYWWGHRRAIAEQASAFVRTAAFAFFFCGLLIFAGYAQILGQQVFWKGLMGDGHQRVAGRTFEEATESVGYLLIAAGAIEALCAARVKREAGRRQGETDGAAASGAGDGRLMPASKREE